MSVYTDAGYANRSQYLQSLAEEYGVSSETVRLIADLLGANEDFDGLINELEDYAMAAESELLGDEGYEDLSVYTESMDDDDIVNFDVSS